MAGTTREAPQEKHELSVFLHTCWLSAGSKKRVMTKRIMFVQLDKAEVTTLLQTGCLSTGFKGRLTTLWIRCPWTKERYAKIRQLVDRGLDRTQSRKSDWRQRTGNRSLDDSKEAVAELRMTRIRSVSSRWRMQKPTSSAGQSSR